MGCRYSGPWMGDQTVSGRNLSHLRQRDALRILAAYEHPITMQIKGERGRGLQDCSTQTDRSWEPLPLSLQHLNLPLPSLGLPTSSPAYQDRHYYNHLSLPQDHRDGGRYEYLPSAPRDTVDMDPIGYQDPERANRNRKGQDCLIGCCNVNLEEPSSFHSQTEDEDFMLGYLPLHHELDSGLGWTDGSLHQGDLSGLETEEGGLEDCHPRGGLAPGGCGGAGFGGGGSPSSESFISSELSDSGFYSVSTGEFRRFQRLLEKRMRLYNARLHHQGEPCERRERRDSCPKSHRELLEAIPEALTMQPLHQCPQSELVEDTDPAMGLPPHGLFRVSSVQFRKADRPCLNRHSSSSGALFNPSHTHTHTTLTPILSTCSTPSRHRRPLMPMQQQQQHWGSSSVGMLRRSRTLHHRPTHQEYRRRASHPASPSYCAATLHHCGGVVPPSGLEQGLPEEGELEPGLVLSHPAGLALSPQQHSTTMGHVRGAMPHMPCYENNANYTNQLAHHNWQQSHERSRMTEPLVMGREIEREIEQERQRQKENELEREQEILGERVMEKERQRELERGRAREQQHSHTLGHPPQQGDYTLGHPPQQGDINETWPKQASRQSQGSGGGLYSTLEGHIGIGGGSTPEQDTKKVHQNTNPTLDSIPSPQPNPNTHPNHNPNLRISRNQLLRDRASRLADERSGMSTDEESNTDLLRGRYWSRTERREHFLLAREQRQQLQQTRGVMRDVVNRGGALAGGGASVGKGGALDSRGGRSFGEGQCNTVLELSQRKLSRLRNRKLLDDWTTVEELLTHGTRLGSAEDMLCPSSLLTVTTV